MTERGLYLDLSRMMDESIARALRLNRSWTGDHVYVTSKEHRMHHVCSVLEALNYVVRRWDVAIGEGNSGWSFTDQGVELFEELHHTWRKRHVD